VSTNYYLHSTDSAESVHIGASAGYAWVTDTRDEDAGWTSTDTLVAFLEQQDGKASRFPAWVAGGDGTVCSPKEAATLIRSHETHCEISEYFG
jgi:hypothetical protein